jgi:hypothetical protein
MAQLKPSQVNRFIKGVLLSELKRDLKAFKLVREADVECAAYMHLRRFLHKDKQWTVLARRHIPHTGFYVDLVLFQRDVPRVAIEIKWGMKTMNSKDRKSLGDALSILGVNKAYWLSAAVIGSELNPIEKTPEEKNALFQLCVRGDLNENERTAWIEARDGFRSKMRTGAGSKLVNDDSIH